MRASLLLLTVVAATGCGKQPSAPPTPASYRFLPASPELVVRIDLVRTRAWPAFAKVAPKALAGVQRVLDDAKSTCGIDIIGDATSVVVARKGPLAGGDVALIVDGLPRAKIASCFTTITKPGAPLQILVDGDVFHARIADKSLASGAWLPSGETVLVMREGQGVDAAAWKTEVTQGAIALPAWTSELDARDPIAVRVVDASHRTVIASAVLADPLVVHGQVIVADAASAQTDATKMKAIADYLSQAKAGSGRVEPKGTTIHADFTARGAEIDQFIATALPALLGDMSLPASVGSPVAPDPAGSAGSAAAGDCAVLAPAVEAYVKEGLAKAPEPQRKGVEESLPKLLPALQAAFVQTCNADHWSAASIQCHVTNATALPTFEKCRDGLTPEQREHLDKKLVEALNVTTRIDTSAPASP